LTKPELNTKNNSKQQVTADSKTEVPVQAPWQINEQVPSHL